MSIEGQRSLSGEWHAVEVKVRDIVAQSSEAFAPETIRNAVRLIAACQNRIRTPDEIEKGYWSTIRFLWDGIEVEVCVDRFEFYDLRDGKMQIEYFETSSDQDRTEKLMERLSCLKIED